MAVKNTLVLQACGQRIKNSTSHTTRNGCAFNDAQPFFISSKVRTTSLVLNRVILVKGYPHVFGREIFAARTIIVNYFRHEINTYS